jgi:hypothetical protein
MTKLWTVFALMISTFTASTAFAEYEGHRLGIGIGLAQVETDNTSNSYLAIGAEYEYRFEPYWGLGFAGNYILSDPNFTRLAAPQVYFHPLEGSWYINAAPLFQFGGGGSTKVGARLGTRLDLSLGPVSIIPQINIDFIDSGHTWIFGIGIAI